MIRAYQTTSPFFRALIMPFKSLRRASIYLSANGPRFVASQSVVIVRAVNANPRFLHTKLPRTSSSVRKWMPTNRMPRFCACTHECVPCRSLPSSGRFCGPAKPRHASFHQSHANGFEILHHILRRSCSLISGKHSSRLRCTFLRVVS